MHFEFLRTPPAAVSLIRAGLAVLFTCLFSQITFAENPGPIRAFVLAGQSNMQGHARIRTIDALRLSKSTEPLYPRLKDQQGDLRRCRQVWIRSLGSAPDVRSGLLTAGFGAGSDGKKFGPEWTFGLSLEAKLDEPILIIKTAWGGKSLHTDFRPPSAGEYEFNASQLENAKKRNVDIDEMRQQKREATGAFYRKMIEHVRDTLKHPETVLPPELAGRGIELSGFVWFQGWNDMVDRGVYPNRDQAGGYDD